MLPAASQGEALPEGDAAREGSCESAYESASHATAHADAMIFQRPTVVWNIHHTICPWPVRSTVPLAGE